ncbi:T9SS type A sorting domain-containing protein [Aquimarina agarilytica]|uniref:T9SS type A sorting domain-containing protein n=1 Tax=Aquimarina agarilytica TaxID=1087449 RepID=UPI000287DD65|nr:T9SS type A sorting domain-containing protein [Aquimarina agarilytica]
MKKQINTFLLSVSLGVLTVHTHAQTEITNDCYLQVNRVKELLVGSDTVIKNEAAAISLLQQCVVQNDAQAQYILGLLHKKGIGMPVNEHEAFKYIELAAKQDYPEAVCELGVLYKDGIGCTLNFDTAIAYFSKAEALGYSKGSYSIGYLYFKGLGSIEQDYAKAIEWFAKSDYPMAQHWLGICNYFGYGMPVNKQKAMELLLTNEHTTNSAVLAEHLETNADLLDLGIQKENTLKATEFSTSKINEVVSTTAEQGAEEAIEISKATLTGEWKGKLIELDWAGKRMNRSFPITLNLTKNKQTQDLDYSVAVNNTTSTSYGIFLDDNFYFDDFSMALPRLYQDDAVKYTLDYNVLSINTIEIKEINNIRYLVANVDTQVTDWNEPGPPMLVVLGNTKALTDNGQEIDQDVIEALAQLQDVSFITLYPNPFKNDLLIQYDLAQDSVTSVELYSFAGEFTKTIVANQTQTAGNHLYHVNGSAYPKGLYVVRVTANNSIHTKLIIKE